VFRHNRAADVEQSAQERWVVEAGFRHPATG
jgi:hypothetical protein